MADLTEHFSWSEMTATSHADLQAKNRQEAEGHRASIEETARLMEQVRSILGVAIRVSSGFRGPSLNARVGGSKTSQHMTGGACDFVPQGMSLDDAFARLLAAGKAGTLRWGQLLVERGWLHVSTTRGRDPARCGEYGHQRADGSVAIDGRLP
jgi:putative chitinase